MERTVIGSHYAATVGGEHGNCHDRAASQIAATTAKGFRQVTGPETGGWSSNILYVGKINTRQFHSFENDLYTLQETCLEFLQCRERLQ